MDASLTEKGRDQAKFITERCKRLPIDLIISSTMNRARETAEIVQKEIGKPMETSALLVEHRFPSEYKGVPEDAWWDTREQLLKEYFYKPGCHYSDEENFEDVVARAHKAWELLSSKKEQHILVITHGSFLRDMVATAIFKDVLTSELRKSMDRGFRTTNTGLTVLRFDEEESRWNMVTWNDHAHLG